MYRILTLLLFSAAIVAAETETVLYSNQPRPLRDLVRQLEQRYGWRITYEEAAVRNLSDLEDASERFKKMGYKPKGPFYVAKSNPISVKIKEPVARHKMKDASPIIDTIKEVLKAYQKAKHPFIFTVMGNGDFFHVIPAAHRDERGKLVEFQPLLNTPVTFPAGKRTVGETVGLVLDQIQQKRGVRIVLGSIPNNVFLNHYAPSSAANTPARRVLIETFEAQNIPIFMAGLRTIRISWAMNYDSNEQTYYFNVHVLPFTKDE